jgi:hypothetical protein
VGFISDLFGGGQAKAIKQASELQARAAEDVGRRAEATQTLSLEDLDAALQGALGEFDTSSGRLDPYSGAGTNALAALQSVLGLGSPESGDNVIAQLLKAPGYQFGLNQGVTALDRGANARSGIYSGAQGKALTQFGQDYAGTQLGSVLDRIQQVVSGGQSAATDQASLGWRKTNAILGTGSDKANVRLGVLDSISNAVSGAASARAGGITGAANARAAGSQNVLSTIGGIGKFLLGGGLKFA